MTPVSTQQRHRRFESAPSLQRLLARAEEVGEPRQSGVLDELLPRASAEAACIWGAVTLVEREVGPFRTRARTSAPRSLVGNGRRTRGIAFDRAALLHLCCLRLNLRRLGRPVARNWFSAIRRPFAAWPLPCARRRRQRFRCLGVHSRLPRPEIGQFQAGGFDPLACQCAFRCGDFGGTRALASDAGVDCDAPSMRDEAP